MATSRLRAVLVALALLICTNGPVFFLVAHIFDEPLGWEVPFVRWTFVVLALVGIWLGITDSGSWSPALFAIVGFTTIIVLSSLWSIAPGVTRGRAWIYVGLAAWAWVVSRLDMASIRRVLVAVLGAALGASIVVIVVSESIGRDSNGDWRGIYTNRNSLGPLCGMGVIVALGFLLERRRRISPVAAGFAVISGVILVGSGSRTAGAALVAALFAATLVAGARLALDRFGRGAIGLAGVTAAAGIASAVAGIVVVWDEPTLAQRRHIWRFVWDRIGERPILGHGWFTAWLVPEFIGHDPLLARGNAHGSVFDVWLGVGLLGLVPFMVVVAFALTGATRDAWREPSALSWTWLALVVFLIVENLTESFVLQYSYNWILLMAAALRSGIGWPQPRGRRTPSPIAAATG